MSGIDSLLDAYEKGGTAAPRQVGAGISAMLDAYDAGPVAPAPDRAAAAPAEPKRNTIAFRGPDRPPTIFEPGPRTDSGALIPGGEAMLAATSVAGRVAAGIPGAITGVVTFPYEVGKASAGAIGQVAGDALFPVREGQREQAAAIGVKPQNVTSRSAPSLTEQYGRTLPNPWEQFVGEQGVDKMRTYAPGFTSDASKSAFAPPPPLPGEKVGLARQAENPWGVISDALMVAGLGAKGGTAPKMLDPELQVRIERRVGQDALIRQDRVTRGAARAAGRPLTPEQAWVTVEPPPPPSSGPPPAPIEFEWPLMKDKSPGYGPPNIYDSIQAGDSVTLHVGDHAVEMTPEHTLDPILRREANAAIEATKPKPAEKAPVKAAERPAPFAMPEKAAAPRPAAAGPIPGSLKPAPEAPATPTFPDAHTGLSLPVRFSGEASQSEVAIEQANRVRDAINKERGSVNFGPALDKGKQTIDYAAAKKDRGFAILRDAISRGSALAGRVAKIQARIEKTRAATIAREAYDKFGARNVAGVKGAIADVKGAADARVPIIGHALDSAERLRSGLMDPEGTNVPDEFKKIQRTQKVREAEPRLREIDAIINDLEKADPKAVHSLIFEHVFDSLPQRDPALQAAVNHANPVMRRMWDMLVELGLRKQWHGHITEFTREHGKANWLPHRLAQEGRKAIIGGLEDRGIVDRVRSGTQGYRKGRTGNDANFWLRAENQRDLVYHVLNEVRRQSETLDQLDVNAQAAFDPMIAVPVQHLVAEKNLRVEQGVLVDHYYREGARTVSDAMAKVNDEISDKILSLDRANSQYGYPANTGVRMDSKIGEMHKELSGLFGSWEKLSMLRNQGITDLQVAATEIAKAKSAVEAEILDVPNKVAALSQQTGQNYIHMSDAFTNAGIKNSVAMASDQRLGMLAGGWVNERMQDAVPYLIRESDGPIARSATAMTSLWKIGQVAYNKTSWFNNGQATSLVAAMNGFPLRAQPAFTLHALSQLLDDPVSVADARIAGLEIHDTNIRADVRAKLDKHLGTEDNASPVVRTLERATAYARHTKIAQGYGFIDDAVRLGAYNYNIKVRGMKPEAAAKDANFAVINATNPPRLVKKFSQRAIGVGPAFLSTTMQMPPRVAKGTLRNPLLAATILTSPWWSKAIAKGVSAQSERDVADRAQHRSLSERVATVALPWKANNRNPREIDTSQWNPYTSMNPLGGRGPGGPLQSLYDAWTNAPDPDTARRSSDPTRRALSATIGPESARALDVGRAMVDSAGRADRDHAEVSVEDAIISALNPWRGRSDSTDRVIQAAAGRAQKKQDQLVSEFQPRDGAGMRAHEDQLQRDIEAAWRSEGFGAEEARKASGGVAPRPGTPSTITLRRRQ